jgi:hypothetical protein
VILTPTHLAIVMDYAAGGELFDRICDSGRFSEDEVTLHYRSLLFEYFIILDLLFYITPNRKLNFSSVPPLLVAGKIFLPAVDLWCELLPLYGMDKQ